MRTAAVWDFLWAGSMMAYFKVSSGVRGVTVVMVGVVVVVVLGRGGGFWLL